MRRDAHLYRSFGMHNLKIFLLLLLRCLSYFSCTFFTPSSSFYINYKFVLRTQRFKTIVDSNDPTQNFKRDGLLIYGLNIQCSNIWRATDKHTGGMLQTNFIWKSILMNNEVALVIPFTLETIFCCYTTCPVLSHHWLVCLALLYSFFQFPNAYY